MSVRRSVFADRLNEFADFASGDASAFERRGRWNDFFRGRIGSGFEGRLIFEIGCFDAKFLAAVAGKQPATAFVGLDWKAKAVYDGAALVAAAGLKNVALLRARAQDLRHIFADGEVDEIWLFHPDPCDRNVELKNRLVNPGFLADVHEVLRDATCTLALKTDHLDYYQGTRSLFETSSARTKLGQQFEVTMDSPDYWQDRRALDHTRHRLFAGERTLFERRFLRKRQPIYYYELQKR